ncbi:MAG TPA: hypothetical protein V6D29_25905 [Leptolyngbyaceae cyanobacterium]
MNALSRAFAQIKKKATIKGYISIALMLLAVATEARNHFFFPPDTISIFLPVALLYAAGFFCIWECETIKED